MESAVIIPKPPIFYESKHYPSLCYLPPDSAICKNKDDKGNYVEDVVGELPIRFYFDITTEQCYPFGTQNCGGNENSFNSSEACIAKCTLI
uniref:BPTI/Kunitz inhibitor domain-containing protein n=1 Tax=Rhabditophanes sp. KR3021 TaxID=114890 RepID=A0AC35TUH0_9BILA